VVRSVVLAWVGGIPIEPPFTVLRIIVSGIYFGYFVLTLMIA
jgi:hypothetical protein